MNSFEVVRRLNPTLPCADLLILIDNRGALLVELFCMKTFLTRIPVFSLAPVMLFFCPYFLDLLLLTTVAIALLSLNAEAWGVIFGICEAAAMIADWFTFELRLFA